MNPADLPPRFAAKINVNQDGCWIFTGALNSRGYGCIAVNGDGSTQLAHRAAYELLVEPIGDGLQIDHLCRVKSCCNPDHLEAVTPGENLRRAIAVVGAWRSRRPGCKRGHAWSEDNTYIDPHGWRVCVTCRRERDRKRRGRTTDPATSLTHHVAEGADPSG